MEIDSRKNQIILMTDPSDLIAIDEIKLQTKYRVKPVLLFQLKSKQ